MDKNRSVLIDKESSPSFNKIILKTLNISGINKKLLEQYRDNQLGEDVDRRIFANAISSAKYFADPQKPGKSKIIAVGKVQSGKTAFFISDIALAFDNGYGLAFVIGGTKKVLRDQNFFRIKAEFQNNPNVRVINFDSDYSADINNYLTNGYKVIVVALKNPAKSRNLGSLIKLSEDFKTYPAFIVDDEGDEYSPGAPQTKKRDNKTHRYISTILSNLDTYTYLSVTATPQAPLLISTSDDLSPDFCVLIEPGKGYIGGVDFHDSLNNRHIEIINDADDFKDSYPESFNEAIHYFIIGCCILRARGFNGSISMLVNPSSLITVHKDITRKITSAVKNIISMLDSKNPAFNDEMTLFKKALNSYNVMNGETNVTFENVSKFIKDVIDGLDIVEFNSTYEGKNDRERARTSYKKFKIYVGGSMLGRGLTIDHLIVTYIYNDSKQTAIDTLYQRARWLGYKSSYYDVCKVYLTADLQNKFIAIVNSESEMWNSIASFLDIDTDIKKWNRVFSLNNDQLILTRKTITKTISLERIAPGFTYDKSISLSQPSRIHNRKIADLYINIHKTNGRIEDFSNNGSQNAFIFSTPITELYENFLSKYIPPEGANLGPFVIKKLFYQAKNGEIPNQIFVIYVRFKTGEERTGHDNDTFIEELPQGRNDGTAFPGDRQLGKYSRKMHLQIHYVYTKDGQSIEDAFPVLALNNPITSNMINFVTGNNLYGDI